MRAFSARSGVAVVGCAAMSVSLLLTLVGCGSTNKTATTAATTSVATPTTTASGASSSLKTTSYNVSLTHITGASGASGTYGVAVLSVKSPADELCWSISPIKNFKVSTSTTTPTIVTIQPSPAGTPSTPGVPLGSAYKPSDCIHAPTAFLRLLEAHPQTFYLAIFNTHSGEAVHGQI
jgi:hypothetical protein